MNLKEKLRSAKNDHEYQKIVLNTTINDHHLASWHFITIGNLKISVCPLFMIGTEADPIPVMVSATSQQLLADHLNCLLPTTKVLDEMFVQADVKISAITHPDWVADKTMGLPHRLVEQVDYLVKAGATQYGVFSFGGWKSWCLSKQLDYHQMRQGGPEAVNHGLYLTKGYQGAPRTRNGLFAYQNGDDGAHNLGHLDYSQACVLMSNKCYIDDALHDTAEILKSPTLSHLLSYDGPLKEMRQPGNYSLKDFGL